MKLVWCIAARELHAEAGKEFGSGYRRFQSEGDHIRLERQRSFDHIHEMGGKVKSSNRWETTAEVDIRYAGAESGEVRAAILNI